MLNLGFEIAKMFEALKRLFLKLLQHLFQLYQSFVTMQRPFCFVRKG